MLMICFILTEFLKDYPSKVVEQWEKYVGPTTKDQWEEAIQSYLAY